MDNLVDEEVEVTIVWPLLIGLGKIYQFIGAQESII